ncbi:hypothetical protein D3870_12040 [Noviherbaspirillum cavernae]|uniref:Uncharacterized protein n=1 Tax=Noviherbaspirillum cavernae TaxID=2320862 RepID=A0A418X2I0_9BURK|nr:hypothetical protein [Noviherbaspirillum cavernae]RJG06646.1 hypothetical protein D3870_12040 [Noviherbaspirillum cavernae]
MSRSNLATYPAVHAGPSYAENVARAALALAAAVLALAPLKSNAVEQEHVRMHNTTELYRLANQFESSMPSQAAELRHLAGRD